MTEPTKFNPGDVVQLKSGGPLMTVLQEGTNFPNIPVVDVVYFDANGGCQERKLPKVLVKHAPTGGSDDLHDPEG